MGSVDSALAYSEVVRRHAQLVNALLCNSNLVRNFVILLRLAKMISLSSFLYDLLNKHVRKSGLESCPLDLI